MQCNDNLKKKNLNKISFYRNLANLKISIISNNILKHNKI